jgi:hypothetical protein
MSKVKVRSVSGLLKEGFNREILMEGFVEVNQAAWPPPVPERYLWTREKVTAQFEHCPHLLFVAFVEDRIIGTLSVIHTNEEVAKNTQDWEEMSGHGTLATHQPSGDCAFGLDLSVRPDAGNKAGDDLIEKGILCCVVLENRRGVFLGSRVPSYRKRAHCWTIEEHVFGKDGRTRDPEIRLYQSEGFQVVKIVPGYMEDPESLNYGVLMFWKNPYYWFTRFIPRAITRRLAQILEKRL